MKTVKIINFIFIKIIIFVQDSSEINATNFLIISLIESLLFSINPQHFSKSKIKQDFVF